MHGHEHLSQLGAYGPAPETDPVHFVRGTPGEIANKWRDRTSAATADYVAGVRRVTRAPGEQAARQAQKYLDKVRENVTKFQRNVAAVTLDEWASAAEEKGAPRLGTGVQAAVGKVEEFHNELGPHIDRGLQHLASMPSTTLADSQARAAWWMGHMASFRKGGGRG
ncbi:MAG TPA: hypothetical protein VGJ25_09985 [Gaiellaceae bacterium]|jgi:hypothetical protein